MLLSIWIDALCDILLFLLISLILMSVGSFFLIRDLKGDYKKVLKMRSKFHIEIRKIVNLLYKSYNYNLLEPFSKLYSTKSWVNTINAYPAKR